MSSLVAIFFTRLAQNLGSKNHQFALTVGMISPHKYKPSEIELILRLADKQLIIFNNTQMQINSTESSLAQGDILQSQNSSESDADFESDELAEATQTIDTRSLKEKSFPAVIEFGQTKCALCAAEYLVPQWDLAQDDGFDSICVACCQNLFSQPTTFTCQICLSDDCPIEDL